MAWLAGDRAARPARDRRHPPRRARDARAAAGTLRRIRRAVRCAFSRRRRHRAGERAERRGAAARGRRFTGRSGADLRRRDTQSRARKATGAERLSARRFGAGRRERDAAPLRPRAAGARAAAARLSLARRRGRLGTDARRMFRDAMRHAGEFVRLRRRSGAGCASAASSLLIDVSGSMKERTQAHLAFAPRAGARRRFGRSLHHRHAAHPHHAARCACAIANRRSPPPRSLVADWDGGTRIGDALDAFLAVPRFAALARGAAVVVLSDGLERGDPSAHDATRSRGFARLAWRIIWLTPLAADPGFEPRTAGLVAARPFLDQLGDGGSIESICAHVLDLERMREGGMTAIVDAHHHIWRRADLPWLDGPMQPRIFGPYEPIRRDYPISEYLADIAGCDVTKSVYVQANWAEGPLRGRSRLCAARRRRDRISAGHRRLCRFSGATTCARSSTG